VSAFFRSHAVNFFTEPILTSHDHDRFEIICYSDVVQPDGATERIKSAVDRWCDTCGLSDEQLADQVRGEGVDILVDLTGHIGNNRLPAFARKPAPVQVTYIGYQNTTGMTAMDYRLTDERADPPGVTDRFYTEKLVRLPRAYFCYRPPDDSPPITPLPAHGDGLVTFGSFNKFAKVSPPAIDAWLRILESVPRSRLVVLANRGGYVENHLRAAAAARGVDPARVEVFDKQPHKDYMKLLARADIALDPFPFNGHTTTCDSIWMGVPVVMLEGQSYVTRFGGSVLANVGLEAWIADSIDRYVDIAVRAAEDVAGLARMRGELRARMADSPLLDFAGFTRNLENAYRRMWRDWCAAAR
jgi:predicted O-linked N-acetylglucosamine transferase (SPINDLY family)